MLASDGRPGSGTVGFITGAADTHVVGAGNVAVKSISGSRRRRHATADHEFLAGGVEQPQHGVQPAARFQRSTSITTWSPISSWNW